MPHAFFLFKEDIKTIHFLKEKNFLSIIKKNIMLKSLKLTKICSFEIMVYVFTKLSVFEIQAKKQPYNVYHKPVKLST